MKPGEIYKLDKNESVALNNIRYVKFKNIKKDENEFSFTLTSLNTNNEKNDVVMSGEDVFDLISSGLLKPATDTDKAKIVLMVKRF